MKSILLAAMMLSLPISAPTRAQTPTAATKTVGVLAASEAQQLMPAAVFFSGQSATTQLRNSGGMRFADGKLSMAALVDTGGYSTSVRDKYQFYLLTETALQVDGKRIGVGAYGAGFVGGSFLLMDIAGNELLRAPVVRDAAMQRPRPLQVVASGGADEFRLYLGREYLVLRRVK